MNPGFFSIIDSLRARGGLVLLAATLWSVSACESLNFGSSHRKFDDNLPELSASRVTDQSLEGMIDRKAELKMLKVQSRMAVVDGSTGSGGKDGRVMVLVHGEKNEKTPARVQLVHGTDKLTYTDTAYYDSGELFRYVSEFSHTVDMDGYFKVTVISDEYKIMNGTITNAQTVTMNKIRDQGKLVKNEVTPGPISGARLGVAQIEAAVKRRIAFVRKKMSPKDFLAAEAQ